MPLKYYHNAQSILCLNGDLPDSHFFAEDKVIVATDGAADKLLKINIKPSIIIGDLDSIEHRNHPDSEMIYLPDQNQSDFQKAMHYLDQNKLLPTMVFGIGGGFIDHILQNINIITEHECAFYSPPLIGYVLKGHTISNLDLKPNTKISLLGMAKAKVKTSGLKWELNNAMLEFPGNNSCFNRTLSENISIEVLEGKLLVMIYTENIEDMGKL
jgi:thiamine pyrophosphokinase